MIRKTTLILVVAMALSGCSALPLPLFGAQAAEVEPTPNALLPTQDRSIFLNVPANACLVSTWESMQTDHPLGDLIAWSPNTQEVAYISPIGSGWYTGNLALASGDQFASQQPITAHILVAGDLSWSPDGEQLAFLALRSNQNIYTVMVYDRATRQTSDLFPDDSARTDAWSSQKGILRWTDSQHVQVVLSCGSGCEQVVEARLSDGSQRPDNQPSYKRMETALAPEAIWLPTKVLAATPRPSATPTPKVVNGRTATPAPTGTPLPTATPLIGSYNPTEYPQMTLPSWSSDLQRVAFIDRRDKVWVVQMDGQTKYRLDTGLESALELKWSPGNELLAVRTDAHIYIFRVDCDPALQPTLPPAQAPVPSS